MKPKYIGKGVAARTRNIYLLAISAMLIVVVPLTVAGIDYNEKEGERRVPSFYEIRQEKVFTVGLSVSSLEEVKDLRGIGIKCKKTGDFTFEVTEAELALLKEQGFKIKILKQAISIKGERIQSQQSPVIKKVTTQDNYEYGDNNTDVNIPDNNGWVYSPIAITSAPSGATVYGIDVHYEIVHSYVGDLRIDLEDEDVEDEIYYTLWNFEGGSQVNIYESEYDIHTFDGLAVNQEWGLWAIDAASGDTGYIDYWWIKVYYVHEEGSAFSEPWAGWWWPEKDDIDPNLYDITGTWQPMKRWDDYKEQGTIARDWEYDNHRSDTDWAGHCHAWSVASYDATEPWVDRPPFNVGDLKGLITECYYDSYIHAIQWDCSYPSNFWIALRNQIYSQGNVVVMDLKLGTPVWNYPVFEYDIDCASTGDDSFNCLATVIYERDDVNASFVGHS